MSISLLLGSILLSTTSTTANAGYPIDLQGKTPENASVVVNTSKPAGASTAALTLTTFDADFPSEGELIINGNSAIPLFGAAGSNTNDGISANVTIDTPASFWQDGNNTLLFKHTNTVGFAVYGSTVSFKTSSNSGSFPLDLTGTPPEKASVIVNTSKPAGASTAALTLTVFDADFPSEGELIINGNSAIALFGAAGSNANDGISANVTIDTPASFWQDGNNTLLFKHINTAGFSVYGATVSFKTSSNGESFPLDLTGSPPEKASVIVNTSKPAGASTASLTLTAYDADFPSEGELIINGNSAIPLFGAAGSSAKDQKSAGVILKTPATYWKNGNNSLTFRHTSTAGYIIDKLNVSFNAGTADESIPASDLPNTLLSSGLKHSGPIVINGQKDLIISGMLISNPNGSCIEIKKGAANIIIEDSVIGPCGNAGVNILSGSHHIEVRGNYIHDTVHEGVRSYESYNVIVDGNMFEDIKSGYGMWTTSIGNLSFTNNFVKNVHRGTDNGGNVANVAFVRAKGIRINNNIAINVPGQCDTEDLINTYKSAGTANDPIQINNNKFYGSGSSLSGGGILLGDGGGSYMEAKNNIIVNPGQYGLAMSGHHNVFANNKVYSDQHQPHANLGVSIGWTASQVGGDCYSLGFSNNEITFYKGTDWINTAGVAPYLYPYFKWSGCSVSGWTSNKFDTPNNQPANLDETILPGSILNYQ